MKILHKSILAMAASGMLATAAHAGGFSTEGINPGGALFNNNSFVMQGALGYAMPQRKYSNGVGTQQHGAAAGTATSSDATPNYFLLSGDLKARINANIDCAIRGHQPHKLHNEVSDDFVGRYIQSEFEIDSTGIDGTCSYKMDVGNGYMVRVIGGVRSTDLEATRRNYASAPYLVSVNGTYPAQVDPPAGGLGGADHINEYAFESDRGFGFRAGAAFEIPQYALRAQVIYDSKISLDLDGTQRIFNGTSVIMDEAIAMSLDLPQSVSARFQTGINPTTLVYGGVRWMNWSDVETLNITVLSNAALNKTLTTRWDDGWTVEAGVQKKLTDDLSGSFGIKWDKGIGGGFTDTWSVNGGLAYDIDENWRVTFGGSVSLLTSSSEATGFGFNGCADTTCSSGGGASNSTYDQGTDWAYAFGTRIQYKIK